ncbi:MAG: NPCBM/NEW2 domain-containing protein [Ignavibacteriales bacterium]|nr:NPCBM/NEW2 domain-containing protein [Ignavibacteriales bacterium]
MNSCIVTATMFFFFLIGCSQSDVTRADKDQVYLSDLKENSVYNIHGGLGRDATYWGFPIQVDGVRYPKAIVTHPGDFPGFVEYDLNNKYSKFAALIALLDDSGENGAYHGNAVFEVELDGRKVFRSRVLQWGRNSSQNIELDVRGKKT